MSSIALSTAGRFLVRRKRPNRPALDSPRVRIVVAPIGLGCFEFQVFIDGGGRLWSLWSKVGAVGNA